jgi:hypothetical protein
MLLQYIKRISAYFISLLFLVCFSTVKGQDTVDFRMKIRMGADVYGPVTWLTDRDILSAEGFISVDIDSNRSVVAEAGYLDFKYSQYNYDYYNKGFFLRLGIDFNLLNPLVSSGKYYAGIGLRYGLSVFRSGIPYLEHENYWGVVEASVPSSIHSAHFIEASPGIRTELFRNFTIGWAVRLRILIYSGTGKNLKAIYIPGYGDGSRSFSPGINYYLIWSIPYKKG